MKLTKELATQRKRHIKLMLTDMLNAGIRRSEIMALTRCSRWTISLWLQQSHVPSLKRYRAVIAAYEKLRPTELPELSIMITHLMISGFDLPKEIGCAPISLENWRIGEHLPQARYRARLVKLYREDVKKAQRVA